MVLVLADALLAAILGKCVLGIEIAPVAITADQAGAARTIRRDVQLDLAFGEIGVAGLVIEPGDARRVQMLDLFGFHHAVLNPGFQFGVLGRLQDAVGIVDGDTVASVLDDLVGGIADLDRGIAVVHRILVARDAKHHGVKAFLHLVIGAHIESGIAVAAPGRITAPGPIKIVVDALLAVGTDKIIGAHFAVQIEAITDTPGDLRLAGIVGGPGIHISLDAALVAAISDSAVPDAEICSLGRPYLIQPRRIGDPVDLLLRAPLLARHRDLGLIGIGKVAGA